MGTRFPIPGWRWETHFYYSERRPWEDKTRERIFAVVLENHFGHMEAGNDVTLSVKTGKFNNDKNTTYGFYQLFYGDTTIGDRLTSTVESTVDDKTKRLVISRAHDHPTDDLIEALAHDKLTLGDDAHLTSTVTATTETKKEGQEICQYGAYLSQTDYKIGKNMQIRYTSIKQKKALQASSRSTTGASSRAMK